ncbi:pilus assembly protein [Desulfolithobacter sp.]
MKLQQTLCFVFSFIVFALLADTGKTTTFTQKVIQESDDAVELAAGNIWKYNLDLYFGGQGKYDESTIDIAATGIRFTNVSVPAGAFITSARIEFSRKSDNDNLDVTISGQLDPDPVTFEYITNDITSRPRSSAAVSWKPDKWKSGKYNIVTPDLAAIVQELVDQPSWVSGNAMAFIFTGTGSAQVKGYGDDPGIPRLVIDYELTPRARITTDPADQLGVSTYEGIQASGTSFILTNIGSAPLNFSITDNVAWLNCSVTSGTLAAGESVTIPVQYSGSEFESIGTHEGIITVHDDDGVLPDYELTATLLVRELVTGPICGDVPLYAQNLVNPAMLIELDISGSMYSTMYVLDSATDPKTPDLSSIVQEIVNQPGWVSGNSMVFMIDDLGGQREAITYDQAWYASPLLHVEFDNNGTVEIFETRVAATQDDAEEYDSGSMTLTSVDLDIGSNLSGIRFQDVSIPQGATILNAYLQFTSRTTKTSTTNATVYGELVPDAVSFTTTALNISNRTRTTSTVSWSSIPAWPVATTETRIKIAKDVLKNLVEDRAISWGFGSWTGNYSPSDDYTRIHEGVKQRTVAETEVLKATIDSVIAGGMTPLEPSLLAGQKYFNGTKGALDGSYFDSTRDCQPKFLIEITDGLGNIATTLDGVIAKTNSLADDKVTTVAIGFGIDDATQIQEIARISNERGHAEDGLYALHEEDGNGVGLPFLAMSGQALEEALNQVTTGVKKQLFYGSSPAPSTSVDHGTFVINAQFNAADWSGDLVATPYDPETGALKKCYDSDGNETCDPALIVGDCVCWTASERMPAVKSAWTVQPGGGGIGPALPYLDATLSGDNYICKDLGDIIRSTPVIVETPRRYYSFDNYRYFKYGDAASRSSMVYVGSNDGALHALDLATGVEQWRFYPEAVHDTLNMATSDPTYDACDLFNYCHRYMVDGSPVVADIFRGSAYVVTDTDGNITDPGWRTILVNGLGNGGGAYFALDITTATNFDDPDPIEYLWQFEDAELGFSTSTPSVERVSYDSAVITDFGGWAVFFGSGFDTGSNQLTKEAYVYGIEAYTGEPLWQSGGVDINRVKLEVANTLAYGGQTAEFVAGSVITGTTSGATATIGTVLDQGDAGSLILVSNTISGSFQDNETITGSGGGAALVNGTLTSSSLDNALSDSLAVDIDFDDYVDALYFGDLYGRMFRLTDIGKEQEPQVSLFFDIGTGSHGSPIRAGGTYAYSETDGEIWIYFGTGQYEEQIDKYTTEQQYFFGIKDNLAASTETVGLDGLVALVSTEVTSSISGEVATYRVVEGSNPGNDPWYLQLIADSSPSERVVSRPLVVGGVVFFATFRPDNDVCAGNGEAWLYALDYKTGLPPDEPVFDINGDGFFDDNDHVTVGSQPYPVAAIPIGRGIPTSPILEDDIIFINTTDTPGSGIPVNLPDMKAKLRYWRDLSIQ